MSEYNIRISIDEAYRYLGGRGEPDDAARQALEDAAAEILKTVNPRVITRICDIERSSVIWLSSTDIVLEGAAVEALLHDCDSCAIFCATIGAEIDTIIRQWELRDVAFAAMLDACANSAVESLCDIVNQEIAYDCSARGQYITDRFSPGYGDLPLDAQRSFCCALDTQRKIGVAVGNGGLMIPLKSVTALIGISKHPQKSRDTGCAGCIKINSCTFRERGVTCYGQIV